MLEEYGHGSRGPRMNGGGILPLDHCEAAERQPKCFPVLRYFFFFWSRQNLQADSRSSLGWCPFRIGRTIFTARRCPFMTCRTIFRLGRSVLKVGRPRTIASVFSGRPSALRRRISVSTDAASGKRMVRIGDAKKCVKPNGAAKMLPNSVVKTRAQFTRCPRP
jgi:hypothetical protein